MLIRTRLIILVAVSVIVPSLLISLLIIYNARLVVETGISNDSRERLILIDRLIVNVIEGLKQDVEFFVSLPQTDALNDQVTDYLSPEEVMMTPLENDPVERDIFQIMAAFGESHPDLAYIFLGMDTGAYVQWPTNEASEFDPRVRPWYQFALNEPEPVLAKPYPDYITQAPIIDYLASFTTSAGQQGVFGLDLTLEQLTNIINEVRFGEAGYVILSEGDGTILADGSNTENNFQSMSELSDFHLTLIELSPGLHRVNRFGEQWFAYAYQSPDLGWQIYGLIPFSEAFASANQLTFLSLVIGVIAAVIFVFGGYLLVNRLLRPLTDINNNMNAFAHGEGDLSARLPETNNDEVGQLSKSFNKFVASIGDVVKKIQSGGTQVSQYSNELQEQSDSLADLLEKEAESLDLVSTAFEEMVQTANGVSNNCSQAAKSARESQEEVNEGKHSLERTIGSITNLKSTLEDSSEFMARLNSESTNIESILNAIRGIAEQTNLLALNAAIEAARAGEQGRGFAVVADEVRTLASKTADSTEEISTLLTGLTELMATVTRKNEESVKSVVEANEQSNELSEKLGAVFNSINLIRDMTTQIAASAEEQLKVSEHINQNIVSAKENSESTEALSKKANSMAADLKTLSTDLSSVVNQFKV